MTFGSPALALAGLIAVALPVAIHLFYRRRHQPIEWAAMELLRKAVRVSASRQRLHQVLLLVLRCLVVAIAGLTIAGPLLKNESVDPTVEASQPRELLLVLDDGVSQQVTIDGVTALDKSKTMVVDAISELRPGDRVGVVLAAGGVPLVWPPSNDLSAAKVAVAEVRQSNTPSMFEAALSVSTNPDHTICVASDFREGSFTETQTARRDEGLTRLVTNPPATTEVENFQVLTIESTARGPSSARDLLTVRARIRREGATLEPTTSVIEATTKESRASSRVVWAQGQTEASVELGVQSPRGLESEHPVRVSIVDIDSQPADNTRFAVVVGSPTIQVAIIDRHTGGITSTHDGASAWLDRALRPMESSDFEVTTIDPLVLDTKKLGGVDAVVITRPDLVDSESWVALSVAVNNGLVVVVSPPDGAEVTTWSDRMNSALGLEWKVARDTLHTETQLGLISPGSTPQLAQLAGELPDLIHPVLVERWLPIDVPVGEGQVVMSLSNGSPFIVTRSPENARGSVTLLSCAVDLGWTNLPAKPLMVPLFQELIRQSVAQVDHGGGVVVGTQRLSQPTMRATDITLVVGVDDTSSTQAHTISVDHSGWLARPITEPGVYRVKDGGGEAIGWVVANIEPAAASVVTVQRDKLVNRFSGASVVVADGNLVVGATATKGDSVDTPRATSPELDGESLAIWFFITLLLLVVTESIFARVASNRSKVEVAGSNQ